MEHGNLLAFRDPRQYLQAMDEQENREASIVAGLIEAEADEAEGRFVDGADLVAKLRDRAGKLEQKTLRRRA